MEFRGALRLLAVFYGACKGALRMEHISFTIMTRRADWRLVWLHTWDDGWDLRFLCFCLRSENNV